MYYRIKNQLDACILADEMIASGRYPRDVADRIVEITSVLDDAYGADRGAFSIGGYVFFFPDAKCYTDNVSKILSYHHVNPDAFEYSEYIGERVLEDGLYWNEELYLLGSDDSLVLIHPQEVANV